MNARTTDPETSHEAARTARPGAEVAVLGVLRLRGWLTDGQIEAFLPDWSPQRVRTARAALVKRGLVRHAGSYGFTASNRRTRVWEATS